MKILVISGGSGSERIFSVRSAEQVRSALAELGHEVSYIDLDAGEPAVLEAASAADLVFPVIHGTGGEDGAIQELLDRSSTPYLGANAAVSRLCFNKQQFKLKLRANGILVPDGEIVTAETFATSEFARSPFVLKPVAEGSSVGVMIARKMPFDTARVAELFDTYGEMLIEELIVGTEITVGVLGDVALPVVEIAPPDGQEFDFDNKDAGVGEYCPAVSVDALTQRRAGELALKVHETVGARHLSRTDMIVTPGGELYVLEINTMPGLTAHSLYPKAAVAAGLSFIKVVERLVELAG
jgi:D-alanine-D-alanine ligase